MFELMVTMDFSAAHSLRGYAGACERLHGHNYRVDATLESEKLDKLGMAMDFKAVKAALADILDRVDHRFLNETGVFKEMNPTAENIAKWIAGELAGKLPTGVGVKSVTVWESDRCGATYRA